MPTERRFWPAVLLLPLLACAEHVHTRVPDAARSDAGAPDGYVRPDAGPPVGATIPWLAAGEPTVDPPALDWLAAGAPPVATPSLPCASGWRSVPTSDGAASYCDPWPTSGAVDCGAGEAHFPGEAGCVAVGRPCPAGADPADLPAGAVILHVRAGAAPGGDGSATAPYATIAEAVASAPDGALLALSRGTYDEAVRLDRPLTLRGACSRDTVIVPSSAGESVGAITVASAGVVIEDLGVGPTPSMGIVVQGGAARVRGVVIAGARGRAIEVDGTGSDLDAAELALRDTASLSDGTRGRALVVSHGASATVVRASLERSRDAGVYVGMGASLVLEDSAVRGVLAATGTADTSAGVRLWDATTRATLRRVVVEGAVGGGVAVDPSAGIDLEDVLVRDVSSVRAATGGLATAGRATLARVAIVGAGGAGLAVSAGASVDATDLVVERALELDGADADAVVVRGGTLSATRASIASAHGIGVRVEDGGHATLSDLTVTGVTRVLGPYGVGVFVAGAGTVLTGLRVRVEDVSSAGVLVNAASASFDDVAIRRIGAGSRAPYDGVGADVENGGTLVLARALVEDARGQGVFAPHAEGAAPPVLRASDLVVRHVHERPWDHASGRGVSIEDGRADLVRVAIEDVREVGLAWIGGSGTGEHVSVRDVSSDGRDQRFGRGVVVQRAHVALAHVRISDVHDAGLFVYGNDAAQAVDVHDLVVRDVRGRALDGTAGAGVVSVAATFSLARALVERTHTCGICSTSGGTTTLGDVVVRDVLDAECATSTCPGVGTSVGIGASRFAEVRVVRFAVSRVDAMAFQIADRAQLDLADGVIASVPIGINVQIPGYAFDRLTSLVTFEDVVLPLDAAYLPVPSAGSGAM